MSQLKIMSGREASMFAALCEAFVAPAGCLPPVRETDAAFAMDANLAVAPPLNRIGLRALFHLLELAPLAMGYGARLRRLDVAQRGEVIERLEHSSGFGSIMEAVRAVAQQSYYGDIAVMRSLGYDPQAVVDRGAALRTTEARW